MYIVLVSNIIFVTKLEVGHSKVIFLILEGDHVYGITRLKQHFRTWLIQILYSYARIIVQAADRKNIHLYFVFRDLHIWSTLNIPIFFVKAKKVHQFQILCFTNQSRGHPVSKCRNWLKNDPSLILYPTSIFHLDFHNLQIIKMPY